MKNYLKLVQIDQTSLKPKYRQIIDAIIYGVETKQITEGDHLPSIHDFCVALDVSKKVIEKAYQELKELGLIASYHGKGHYIKQNRTDNEVLELHGHYRSCVLEPLLKISNN